MREKRNKKVIVAMSGGIDSSVAAALLRRAGFDIVGVFMKFWSPPEANGLIGMRNRCCSSEAEKRARQVAQILDIPFYVLNFEEEFKKTVVDYFLREYRANRTPNPCVVCNKKIKFGLLLEKALDLGADFVATGHYVRKKKCSILARSQQNATKIKGGYHFELLKAKDKEKDQSYFLWQLSQNQLKHILFPIGDYTKKEVRSLAKKFRLPFSGVGESQEVCFIKNTTEDFLRQRLKEKPGKIVMKKGEEIGNHKGLWFYTIGQRKRIGLSGGPYYVLDKDFKRNALIVTKNKKDLEKKELIAENVNWISEKVPKWLCNFVTTCCDRSKWSQKRVTVKAVAKIRYRSSLDSVTAIKKVASKRYKVVFIKPQRAITPGQSVVFYRGEEVLGGGIIRGCG